MNGTCLAAGMFAGEESYEGGEGTKTQADVGKDLAEVGCSAEVDNGWCFKEFVCGWVKEEDVETFSQDVYEFREAKIIDGDKGDGVGVMGVLWGPDDCERRAQEICLLTRDEG